MCSPCPKLRIAVIFGKTKTVIIAVGKKDVDLWGLKITILVGKYAAVISLIIGVLLTESCSHAMALDKPIQALLTGWLNKIVSHFRIKSC